MIPLEINGKRQNVDLPGDTPLLWALRDELGLTDADLRRLREEHVIGNRPLR